MVVTDAVLLEMKSGIILHQRTPNSEFRRGMCIHLGQVGLTNMFFLQSHSQALLSRILCDARRVLQFTRLGLTFFIQGEEGKSLGEYSVRYVLCQRLENMYFSEKWDLSSLGGLGSLVPYRP